ncbi:MAG: DUF2769 domain-containing protein [Euryarchaeota archaeon]|nr:DUF2769 domain-containing protein [Euryarchaeota archaeon]
MDRSCSIKTEFGRYFGICPSYHHSKGCKCQYCESRPDEGGTMYCARGNSSLSVEDQGCLCRTCYVYSQFSLEGDRFCRKDV